MYAVAATILAFAAIATAWIVRHRSTPKNPLRDGKYIAVLPFRAVGSGPDLKYEAEGISDAISQRLSSLNGVHPVSPLAIQQVD
jgi:TolB-like protein